MKQTFNEKEPRPARQHQRRTRAPERQHASARSTARCREGDAVWEGLRLYGGTIFRLVEHLERLRSSAKALAFEGIPSNEELIAEIRRTLEANGMRDGVHIRLTLTRGEKITSGMDPRLNRAGPTLIVLAEHKEPVYSTAGLSLVTSSIRRFPPDCLDPKIHHANLIQSILAKIEANVAGADDALMLDRHGFVAETNATHVFLVEGGTVVTGDTRACPEGITRSTVLDICRANGIEHEVRGITTTDVYPRRRDVLHGNDGRDRGNRNCRRAIDRQGRAPVPSQHGLPVSTGKRPRARAIRFSIRSRTIPTESPARSFF